MSKTKASPKGRPKDPEKRANIMEVAGRLFLEQGYNRTSVDTIAGEAGVSKYTVYSHFEGKEGLFKCLVSNKCQEYAAGWDVERLKQLPLEEALTRLAEGYTGLLLNPDVLAFQRLMIADAASNPELMAMFYDSGPRNTLKGVADILAEFDRLGLLRIADSRRAAEHFLSMLRGFIHWRALLNVEPHPGARKLRAHVRDCVAVFMRAYTVE